MSMIDLYIRDKVERFKAFEILFSLRKDSKDCKKRNKTMCYSIGGN